MAYTAFLDETQPLPPDVEILSEGDIVPDGWGEITVAEASQFAKRIQEPRERVVARNAIFHAAELGAINAHEAIIELDRYRCFDDPEHFLRAYIAGVRALNRGETA